ncbi:hypothetical protein WA158_001331 [Blastocystis sp. Blastoise]
MQQQFDVKQRYRSQSLMVRDNSSPEIKQHIDDDFRLKYLQKLEYNQRQEKQCVNHHENSICHPRSQSVYTSSSSYANSQPIKIPETELSPISKTTRGRGTFNFTDVDLACSYSVCGRCDNNSTDGSTETEEGNDDFIPPHLQVQSDDDHFDFTYYDY